MVETVCVRLFASLRDAAGKGNIVLEFRNRPTLQEVLEEIRKIPELERMLFREGRFERKYKIFSGSNYVDPESFENELAEENIAILPPVSGG